MTNLPEQAHDYGTVEFDEVILTLRDDLVFTLQKLGEHECYLIEDPVNSTFFRVGIPEYAFISLLNGKMTVRAALATTSAALGPHAFTTRDAAGICKWLIESQLATTPQSTRAERMRQQVEKKSAERRRQWLNPLMLKVPLLRPDPLVRRLMPVLGGVTGLPFLLLWIGTVLFALYRLVIHWDRATSVGSEILSMENWLWLAGTYIALKLVHETFHAAFCKRFGGEVREAGVLFILFAPIPYVDVTSCWRFRSKWQRIATSAAGMYAELWIAAVATVIWSYSEIGLVRHHAFNVMILGSVTTLFFNANPLMRFDGYYILSDVLGLPNLYSRGQQFVLYLGRRYLMGIKVNPQQATLWRDAVIRTYGVAALLWRIFVCATLVVAAESLFHGVGLILSLLALILWLAWPLGKFCRYLYRGNSTDRPNRLRFAATTASTLCFVFLVLRFVPWPGGVQADAFVDYEDAVTVRAAAPGFVQRLHVRAGDRVGPGDLLATLENRQLRADLADIQLAVRQSELRARQFHAHQEIAAEQVETKTRAALVKRLRQLQRQVDNLTIRAPIGGTVVGTELDALPGSYLIEGGDLLTIGDESRKQLQLSISQEDVDRFRQALGRDVRIRLRGSNPQRFAASIAHIDPRATTEVPHAALSAAGGGRLPVRANDRSPPDGSGKWQFLAPRLSASIPLDATRSETLHVGQVGRVKLQDGRESIGGFLRHRLQKWLRHHVRSTLIN